MKISLPESNLTQRESPDAAECSFFNFIFFLFLSQQDSKQSKILRHFPARSISITFNFVDTIFIENSNRSISITRCGSAIVWSNSIVMEMESSDKRKNRNETYKREFIKSIKLCKTPLTVIKSVDDCIVIADARGKIRFYDKELKIIFWCPSHDFIDTIITISFDKSPLKRSGDDDTKNHHRVRDFLIRKQKNQFRSQLYLILGYSIP